LPARVRAEETIAVAVREGAFAVLLALVVTLGACAQDDAEEAATSIEVVATEFAFDPDSWTVAADTDVSVTMENAGTTEHEWVVIEEGTTIADLAEFGEDLVEFEVEAASGESATDTFSLAAGTYQVICAIPGHLAGGMEGELTVQ
jgi:uncharacterized cupredoxin-like copper-binding protein